MIILPAKEVLLLAAQDHKEIFLFDPKTTAVLHKFRDDLPPHRSLAYYPHSQQFVTPQNNKTFLNVWSVDAPEPQLRVSLSETIALVRMSQDGHFLFGGSHSGNIYIWELPGGVLLKKKSVHAGEVRQIIQYQQGYLFTAARNEVKMWALSSFLIDSESSTAVKTFNPILEIIGCQEQRKILLILTPKSLTFLQCSLQTQNKEFSVISKVDYQLACSLCVSKTAAYVGDGKGNIQVLEIIPKEEERAQLYFKLKEGTREIQISKPKKKKILTGPSKQPVTCLAFLQTLGYLVSGHSSGQVTIWHNYEVKKSIHLFKSAIQTVAVIPRPADQSFPQSSKIRPLHKYQQSKQHQLLDIIPQFLESNQQEQALFRSELQDEQDVMWRMLQTISNPQRILRDQIKELRQERNRLLEHNLEYFNRFCP